MRLSWAVKYGLSFKNGLAGMFWLTFRLCALTCTDWACTRLEVVLRLFIEVTLATVDMLRVWALTCCICPIRIPSLWTEAYGTSLPTSTPSYSVLIIRTLLRNLPVSTNNDRPLRTGAWPHLFGFFRGLHGWNVWPKNPLLSKFSNAKFTAILPALTGKVINTFLMFASSADNCLFALWLSIKNCIFVSHFPVKGLGNQQPRHLWWGYAFL